MMVYPDPSRNLPLVEDGRLPASRVVDPSFWREQRVLITGGLGFIGSNLALVLARLGAKVVLVDSLHPGLGGNWFNIANARQDLEVHLGDIRDARTMRRLAGHVDVIFHTAAQTDHLAGLTDPLPDIDINIRGTATLLDAVRKTHPTARLVHLGTRGQYGRQEKIPVAETAVCRPLGVHEITKAAAESLVLRAARGDGLAATCVRLSNVYGPRAQMRHSRMGVANWLLRRALDGDTLPLYGQGKIVRDFLFVDDAIEALLLIGQSCEAVGTVMNLGGGEPITGLEFAQHLVTAVGGGRIEFAPHCPERRAVEPGDFVTDISRALRLLGWKPTTSLPEGLERTARFYRDHAANYWTQPLRPVAA